MRWQQRQEYVPGTTSRASIASLYSMKPKPFMSLISVISPVPWVLKWFSTSALVATVHAVQSANSVELSEGPQAQAPAPTAVDQCQGGCITMQGCATGQSATETRRRCGAEVEERIREQGPATSTSALPGHGMQRPRVLSCARVGARAGNERGVYGRPYSGELKEAYRCAGGCQGRGAVQREYVR